MKPQLGALVVALALGLFISALAGDGQLPLGLVRLLPAISMANADELTLPDNAAVEWFDFAQKGIEGWTVIKGRWGVEEISGAPSGKRVLIQHATENAFNVILAPGGPYMDVDVSVRFKPISGREDASGGIVFRFSQGRYYVVRANALEDSFRLYYYHHRRDQLATARVEPPPHQSNR